MSIFWSSAEVWSPRYTAL